MIETPKREPSPVAARISSPVSGEMMMPISRMPAAAIASMPKNSTGLLATGTSCFADVYVMGRRRVPRPPERIRPLRSAMSRAGGYPRGRVSV